MKRSIQNSEHYIWADKCSGWHLVKTNGLSCIQGPMPPNTEEKIHYHESSQQFFDIFKGKATFIINEETTFVNRGEGLHITPKTIHQIKNISSKPLQYLIITQPASKGDIIEESFTTDL